MIIVEAYQIPSGNVSPDIFALPCVRSIDKKLGDDIEYSVWVKIGEAYDFIYARPSDWICKDERGKWHVLSDKEYRKEVMT
jgi:hypothetical protein